jgi:hypothetical protein
VWRLSLGLVPTVRLGNTRRDLRKIYLSAHRTELAWIIVVQPAKAAARPGVHNRCQGGQEEATPKVLRNPCEERVETSGEGDSLETPPIAQNSVVLNESFVSSRLPLDTLRDTAGSVRGRSDSIVATRIPPRCIDGAEENSDESSVYATCPESTWILFNEVFGCAWSECSPFHATQTTAVWRARQPWIRELHRGNRDLLSAICRRPILGFGFGDEGNLQVLILDQEAGWTTIASRGS